MIKEEVRIDKWLWAVRLFKTRTLAAEACKKGKITIDTVSVKPSRTIRVNDVIQIKKPPITYAFKVLAVTENRMGAKLVPSFMENVTSEEQYAILELSKISGFIDRDKGTGRPTKKDRRSLESFLDTDWTEE
ncbi:MAG: RNA-binding S4 domain-containing protein [Paludibacteraceae bacterium]|jgi:ribosome-associated heat shock protein Hsp15|nr:RNA-binding S4 domain-containing protein [Paludibacteraceae bacterium]NLK92920.1 RNA-binding S4 domain-containing protein [Bacteroidales bacterium]MBP6435940.1 RNA-binding S4 domain-containing protein [Paludibacteraceae bacterium]MBP8627239.1 RNA-binding S4 domain-containing protein [Paludibacteraceae bacterium]MBP8781737.1 RNA-binding S4 domain-containing protein [Paludibacteraceae bacterium]